MMISTSTIKQDVVTDLVIVDGSTSVTGGLRAAVRIATLLSPQIRTHLVIPRGGAIPRAELKFFTSVTTIPGAAARKSARALATYFPASIAGSIMVRRLLRRTKAQTVLLNDFPQIYGWLIRKLGFEGVILTFVRFAPDRFPAGLAKLWLTAALRSSDRVIAVSKFIQRQLPAAVQSHLLYDCIDPTLTPGASAPRHQRIVCIANYISGKGQDDTLEAFAKIAARFPEATLAFHGGDMGLAKNAAYRSDLMARRDRVGLTQRIEFNPFAEYVSEPLALARVAINLSRSESFSFTCLEAAQLGVPVIAYRSGGPEEIIVDGSTGFLCPIGDVDLVADRIAQLLEDPELAARMGRAARAIVLQRFGPDNFVAGLRSMLAG